ncbi:unnamed protein product [Miscanthus lutarioriparius]|uniref:Uncharacterized protein n=1 Tax=Miscanthus lutarioriparius TaxID=422564 RepID=A0A811RTX6_9POAL|nr:unnamed protein product [Miscanthus lutarioriparius]
MATKPYFLWGDTHATSLAAFDSGVGIFKSSALETAAAPAAATAATDSALVSPELGVAAVARPRQRRDSSGSGKKKQQHQEAGGGVVGAKKPPQRGLGVAELERLRCGGDPLLELSAVVGDAAAGAQGQGHPLLHYHHHHRHLQMPAASAFEAAAGGRYCSQLLAPAPPPPPPGPVCVLHPPAAAGCQRAPPVAPEQQYFRDQWSRMGGFSTAGGGADHQSQSQLLPATLAPEHPSSQNTIWRPAVSSSSCLHTGHRCDICSRRMRALAENGGALAPTPSDTAMATARQGDAFLARERKQGPAEAEAPAKKDVREIEFFPAASAHHTSGGGRVFVPNESELTAPFSSTYGGAASHTAPQLDLSLRL